MSRTTTDEDIAEFRALPKGSVFGAPLPLLGAKCTVL